jgi:hypothetical protein
VFAKAKGMEPRSVRLELIVVRHLRLLMISLAGSWAALAQVLFVPKASSTIEAVLMQDAQVGQHVAEASRGGLLLSTEQVR